MAAAVIDLHVPQVNPTAQRALQEFRRRQPQHLWVDDGLVEGTPRFWVCYEPPLNEQEARTKTCEILREIEVDGIDLGGIRVAQ